jgi:hypothetical protein
MRANRAKIFGQESNYRQAECFSGLSNAQDFTHLPWETQRREIRTGLNSRRRLFDDE